MTEVAPEATASTIQQAPAAAAPAETSTPTESAPAKRSLEDLLGSLDDTSRSAVMEQVRQARSEAKNLRDRLKEAEPIVADWRRLEEASKTELEKAQETAKAAAERATKAADRIVTAELRAALTGVVDDPKALIEDLNLARFRGEDGEVNEEAISALREKYAALAPKPGMKPNPAQGKSASPAPTVHDQIAQAQAAGDMKAAIRLKSRLALDNSDTK